MEALYDEQLELLTKIRGFTALKARPAEKQTKGAAQSQLDRLIGYFDDASQNHDKLVKKLKDNTHAYYADHVFDSIEDAYFEAKGDFNDFFIGLEASNRDNLLPNVSNINNDNSLSEMSFAFQHLPPIDLPSFSGKHAEWEEFQDFIRSMVHRRERMSAIDKYHYLRTHVQGQASVICRKLPLTAENYGPTWDALVAYYENKRRLVNAHLTDFMAIKPMKADNAAALSKLLKLLFL